MIRRLALALAASLPLAGVAQTPPAPAPAAPAGPTVDFGGWLVFNSFATIGGTNSTDLPQRAIGQKSEVAASMQVRQSRLRANLGLPGGGLLGDAKLKGLVELDFAGGAVGGDQSLPLVRLRHAWVSATWKDLGNLTLTLGQTWGLFEGPYFASSLGHLAVPRFAGAGFLFRRAPQARLSGDIGGDLGILWAGALLAPMDKATVAAAQVPSGAGVGERSGTPDVEGRLALVYRPGKKNMLETGVSFHYGYDRYLLAPGTANLNKSVGSTGLALDAKLDLPGLTILGAVFNGYNLDIYSTSALGVKVTGGATPTALSSVQTSGAWVQLQWSASPTLQFLLGAGAERPAPTTLPVSTAAAPVVKQTEQYSGGAVLALAPKWKAALEFTHYATKYNDAFFTKQMADQVELSTLYAF